MRSLLFRIFRKIVKPFYSKGFGQNIFIRKIYSFLFYRLRPKGIARVLVQGSKMYINVSDTSIAPSLLMSGAWEKVVTILFKQIIKPGMVFVDVGANIGYYTLIAAKLVGPAGKVYAFEPEPENYKLLIKNVEENQYKNVFLSSKAVSNKIEVTQLILHPTGGGAHSLKKKDIPDGRKIISVETTTMDKFFENKGGIDAIKIDVEGFEPAVLEGMGGIINGNPNLKLFVEFWPDGIRDAGYSPEIFLKDILSYGLNIFFIDEQNERLTLIDKIDTLMEKSQDSFNLLCSRSLNDFPTSV